MRTLLVLITLLLPASASAAVPLPPQAWRVTTAAMPVEDGWAGADPAGRVIYAPNGLDRFQAAHEVGHLLDWQVLDAEDREWFRRLLAAPAGDWYAPGGAAEWFADYYAAAAVGLDPTRELITSYATPTLRRLTRFRLALYALGLREGLRSGTIRRDGYAETTRRTASYSPRP